MAELAASLLAADFSRLNEQLAAVEAEGIRYLHIDVMDGLFVPSLSFGFPVIKTLRKGFGGIFDVHLMIHEPIRYIKEFAESGADSITVHVEACSDVEKTLRLIRECGVSVGLALKPATDWRVVKPFLHLLDMILIMTVEPGFGGQRYMDAMTGKIAGCRRYLEETGTDRIIEVDGGMNEVTVQTVVRAGSTLLVSGSSIFDGDVAGNIRKLNKRIKEA